MSGTPFSKPKAVRHPHRHLIGRRVLHYRTVGSTQDVAQTLAAQGAEEGTAVLADQQSAARGRFGRPWVAPAGGSVSVSVVLYPSLEMLARLGIAAAVAVSRAIRRVAGLEATVKWPNDVRVGGRKVCGILVESQVFPEGRATAILGIGLNVDLDTRRYPELAATATGLAQECGHAVSVAEAAEALLDDLDALYDPNGLAPDVFQEWRTLLDTLGREVEVRWGDAVKLGLAEDVDAYGNLVLRRADGSRETLPAGEVTLQV